MKPDKPTEPPEPTLRDLHELLEKTHALAKDTNRLVNAISFCLALAVITFGFCIFINILNGIFFR